jgi:hypothetical protein
MALSETLKNILETIVTSPCQGEASVARVAERGSAALTMTSSATPEVQGRCGSGVARVAPARLPPVPHTECQKRVAEQPLDPLGVTEIATPVTPATPDLHDRQPFRALFFAGGRRLAPCLHHWVQEGQRAICAGCGLTVPLLPNDDVLGEQGNDDTCGPGYPKITMP